jgi:hypothetical protein
MHQSRGWIDPVMRSPADQHVTAKLPHQVDALQERYKQPNGVTAHCVSRMISRSFENRASILRGAELSVAWLEAASCSTANDCQRTISE